MIDKLIMAMVLPGFLVVFFTRVTFNRYLGLGLTVALIAASAYKGYTHTWPLIIIDAASLTIGFWLSSGMMKRQKSSP
ncbi:CsbA family protein [Bacillus sp. B190/17]|uniref:CsbA family protein n=1 Tax=Bacillus lumedeiriae TaxID=3058829 RepID=A0ABW8I8F5_9BACI